jgi:hypothetical protein
MLSFESQSRLPWPADGTLTVTSVRPNSSDVVQAVTGYATYPGLIREAEPSNGVFQYQDCKVTFDRDAVEFQLKPRDTLEFDDQTWIVKQAQRYDFLRFWDVQCFRLVAQVDLCDTIAVYRPTVTVTSDGLRSRTLSAVSGAIAIAGRLQSDGWQQEPDTDGRLLRRQRFTAYLSQAVLLEAGDVLRVGGTDYEVIGQAQIDQIATFTRATVTRTE